MVSVGENLLGCSCQRAFFVCILLSASGFRVWGRGRGVWVVGVSQC